MWPSSNFTIPAVAAISFCLIGGTVPAAADILHVPGDFPTIQAAIDAAVDGDEVEVHPGTYNENIDFLGKAIRVYSTDGPDVTIIDAQQMGTVVICFSAEGPDSVLEGFTITGGNAGFGGGMRIIISSPTVTNCTFSGNTTTTDGGGMYIFNSSPTVTNCTFSGNTATSDGGGMHNNFSVPTVTNCTFSGNTADGDGGGMYNFQNSNPSVINCTFSQNTATDGGGMFNTNTANPTVADSFFCENEPDHIEGRWTDDGGNEFLGECSCPWDIDGSGTVGASDLLSLLVSWGPCKGCPADFDGDGIVGASDLLTLLVNWGPCP
ncbi:MAG: right-handed parallel beta-helix repeat-containing protein [Phycisphaerales bacterium]